MLTRARSEMTRYFHKRLALSTGSTIPVVLGGCVVRQHKGFTDLGSLGDVAADPPFEDAGVGSTLARGVFDDIRDRQLKALVICPFINNWPRQHRDDIDVVFSAPPAKTRNEMPT